MKKIVGILLLVVAFTTACPSSTVTTMAKYTDSVATINQGFQAGAQSAHQAGLISAAEDIQLQQIVKQVADINDKLATAYREAQANNSSWVSDVDTALTLGANLNANSLLFIKNETKRAELTAIIVGIRSTLDLIASQVKGVKAQ